MPNSKCCTDRRTDDTQERGGVCSTSHDQQCQFGGVGKAQKWRRGVGTEARIDRGRHDSGNAKARGSGGKGRARERG